MGAQGAIAPVPDRAARTTKARLGLLLAASIGSGVAHLGTSTMPFQVGALMDGLHLSASAAGVVAFCQISALAISMLLVAPLIHRFHASWTAIVGAAIGVVAHALLYQLQPPFVILCAIAVLAGTGYGLVFAATVAGVAACANPDRVYAIANGGALVVIVGLMLAFPYASSNFGLMGPFLCIAIVLLISLPVYFGFQKSAAPVDLRAPAMGRAGVVPLLLIWSAFSLGTGAVWSFAERIGHSLGLTSSIVALVLSVSTFCGIGGTAIAATTAGLVPRLPALWTGLLGTALGCLLLGLASGVATYAAGVFLYWVFYMYLYSYLLGTAAALDASGRVGTAGGGCERLGFAFGAPLGGLLIDRMSYAAVGILGALGCVLVLPFCFARLKRGLAVAACA